MALDVSREIIGDVLVLHLQGPGSEKEASARFREAVRQAFDKGYRKVVLDFAGLTYQDSMFLGSLVSAWTTLTNLRGKLVFVNVSTRVMAAFQITRLEACFQFFNTLPEALEYFGATPARAAVPTPEP
jgi:anti-anti-sigma factor